MQIYICLGLALAIIAGIVYMSLASSPKQIKVTFNDVEDDTTGGQKKRAKVKPPSADAKPNWAQAAGLDPYDKDTLFQAVD